MNKTNLLTVKKIAEYLSVHEITIYRLLKQNKIPALRIGGQWRFDLDTIRAWLDIKGSETMSRPVPQKGRHKSIPKFLWRYFWDTDPKRIYLDENSDFILERILDYGDIDAVEWLKKNFSIYEIKDIVMKSKRLTPRSVNFWRLVLNLDKETISCLREPYLRLQRRI